MPHIHLDYSPNLEERLDMAALCRLIRDEAAATGILPLAGLRVRATPARHVVMADGQDQHAYLDISLRLRAGRSPEDKAMATQRIFDAVEAYCAPVLASSSFMLSFEMRDIDPAYSPKTSSIRQYLTGDQE